MSPDPLQLLTPAEAGVLLRMSESWVLAEIAAGHVRHRQLGDRSLRLTRDDVAEIIAAAERGPQVQLAEVHDIHSREAA